MMAPYGATGTASIGAGGTAGRASGSGYGTSSGLNRVITAGSQTISPPDLSVRISESPSRRCALIESERPDEKNANSARAGTADSTAAANEASPSASRGFITNSLPRIDERVVDANSQLARIRALRIPGGRRECLVHNDVELGHVRGAELRRRHRDLLEDLLTRGQRERIQRLRAQGHPHLLRAGECGLRLIDLQIKD